ncbi:MAG: site-specific DNA-methyltransferase [Pyrinomonadaceae bacterium]|nr:site-specific DNA-methyltransferase [Pyrinomonadaceae bacterium]
MFLNYENKLSESEIIANITDCHFISQNQCESENKLIYGDNLLALKKLSKDYAGKIDLIYIDPPFATNNTFTISENRANSISNIKNGKIAYTDNLKGAEFLEFLRKRLILLKMLLSEQGSIYLHIDYKIGHYVKILMDEIFGIENFRNDITRVKCNPKNFARKAFGNVKDLILFYTKSENSIWNEPKTAYSEQDKFKLFPKTDNFGRRYTTIPLHAPGETTNGNTSKQFKNLYPPKGRHWRTDVATLEKWDEENLIEWSSNGNPRKKIYFDEQEGKRLQDIWEMKDPQYPNYPTEKNEEMLDLIVKTSSKENSFVLDCFCGSGTTLKSAHQNSRKWIGIDCSEEAINVTKQKLSEISQDLFVRIPEYEFIKLESL